MAKKSRTEPETVQIGMRLPVELVKRLDEHIERLQERTPGVSFSRTDAMKALLTKALEQEES